MIPSDSSSDPASGSDWTGSDSAFADEGGFSTLRQILFPRTLPGSESLAEVEIASLLGEVQRDLVLKGYRLEFIDRLPARTAYRGLIQMLDSPLPVADPGSPAVEVDGCDSACEACFQLAYCPVARKVLGASWRKALEQAGSNPSWAALYATDDVY